MEKSWKSISRTAPAAHISPLIAPLVAFGLLLGSGCMSLHRSGGADPLSAAERINLGVTYEQDGKPDLALREYERAARGGMAATAWVYQANLHADQGDAKRAERAYRKALEIDPDHTMALNNLAWLLLEADRNLDEAEALVRRALTLNPEPRAPYEHTLQAVRERRKD